MKRYRAVYIKPLPWWTALPIYRIGQWPHSRSRWTVAAKPRILVCEEWLAEAFVMWANRT